MLGKLSKRKEVGAKLVFVANSLACMPGKLSKREEVEAKQEEGKYEEGS